MTEFRQVVGALLCPDISREEIVNACGVDDFHDGVNYVRTACVIAVAKARDSFEPFLHQVGGLGHRQPSWSYVWADWTGGPACTRCACGR